MMTAVKNETVGLVLNFRVRILFSKAVFKDLQKLKCVQDTNQTTDQNSQSIFFWCYKVFNAISVLFIASCQTVGELDLAKKVLLKITCCNLNAIVFFLK